MYTYASEAQISSSIPEGIDLYVREEHETVRPSKVPGLRMNHDASLRARKLKWQQSLESIRAMTVRSVG
jgi:hypothetical protein